MVGDAWEMSTAVVWQISLESLLLTEKSLPLFLFIINADCYCRGMVLAVKWSPCALYEL